MNHELMLTSMSNEEITLEHMSNSHSVPTQVSQAKMKSRKEEKHFRPGKTDLEECRATTRTRVSVFIQSKEFKQK